MTARTRGTGWNPDEAGAQARRVLERFLAAFSAADLEALLSTFWPDALVWGTTMEELATSPDAVRSYFAPVGSRRAEERRAGLVEGSTLALSASVGLISATWRIDAVGGGAEPGKVFRISLAVARRGDAWRIAQFHNSPLWR